MINNIIVIGGGGHAKVVISIINKLENWQCLGYTDNLNSGKILNAPYLGNDGVIEQWIEKGIHACALGIGFPLKETNDFRLKIINNIIQKGATFVTLISPHAIINENVNINSGAVVMDGVVINTGSRIGDYSVINTQAVVEHECNIGNHTHIAPGVVISGEVSVGNYCYIGSGAVINNGITIHENVLIGSGSVVVSNITKPGTYVGNPVRKIK
jgi:sugar O-acyltransferase (sialic acid O-acetyltransferase NeuD family)